MLASSHFQIQGVGCHFFSSTQTLGTREKKLLLKNKFNKKSDVKKKEEDGPARILHQRNGELR
jgi:hypothetical protein